METGSAAPVESAPARRTEPGSASTKTPEVEPWPATASEPEPFDHRCRRIAAERCQEVEVEGCSEALTCHCLEAVGQASGCAEKHTYFWQNWAARRRAKP
ncbi:MAG: hypothetical protein ACE5FG_10965 [Myxococcota bacterium]